MWVEVYWRISCRSKDCECNFNRLELLVSLHLCSTVSNMITGFANFVDLLELLWVTFSQLTRYGCWGQDCCKLTQQIVRRLSDLQWRRLLVRAARRSPGQERGWHNCPFWREGRGGLETFWDNKEKKIMIHFKRGQVEKVQRPRVWAWHSEERFHFRKRWSRLQCVRHQNVEEVILDTRHTFEPRSARFDCVVVLGW